MKCLVVSKKSLNFASVSNIIHLNFNSMRKKKSKKCEFSC